MSDDSFIREVDEELRQDQFKALWKRYGGVAIALAVLVVVLTGGWRGYEYWTESRANKSGDAFLQALELAKSGETEAAREKLQELEESGYGAYPVLARLREATLLAEGGDPEAAVAAFDAAAQDSSIPEALRDIARLRAAYLLVDHGSYDDVAKRAELLILETNPMRHSAREALALAAWKAGKASDALVLFDQIVNDSGAPANLRGRASLMTDLIRGAGDAS